MDFVSFKNAVIAKAESLGITEYELYYRADESTSIGIFKDQVDEFSASSQGGVCFRCIVNGKMGYASTEELSEKQAVAIVEKAADHAGVLESEEPVFLCEGGKEYAQLQLEPYALPATDELIRCALETQKKLYATDAKVVDGCQTNVIAERSTIAISNSKGLELQYENNLTALVVASVVSDGTEMTDAYQIKVGQLDKLDVDAITKKATENALQKMGGDVAPTGQYPVVFDPQAMSDLLETFASVFSSEVAQKGLSRLADKEGTQVAASVVTLVDDPFHPENPMPIHFDAEGCPTCKKNVIEKGVLQTLLYNMKTAAVAGRETTGNGAKGGYDAPVAVRPFTMYIAPGEISEEQLLEKAGNGVYITSLGGLHAGANPVTGDFSLQSAGFMIENGKKTTPVKSFTVAGNFYDLLKGITTVADNVQLPRAIGMTAYGSPTVLVEGLSVAGK